MATEANTTIWLCKGVPCDSDYDNTLYFDSAEKRDEYFNGKRVKTYTENSYQRINNNTIKLAEKADDIIDCNYMVICNTNHSGKKYFCFIMEVNYVNENCCEVVYKIDVIQTWLWDCELEQSFIVRQHTVSDIAGDNLVNEDLYIGKDYVTNVDTPLDAECKHIMLMRPINDDNQIKMHNVMIDPTNTYFFKNVTKYHLEGQAMVPDEDNEIDEYRDAMGAYIGDEDFLRLLFQSAVKTSKASNIISMYMVPDAIYENANQSLVKYQGTKLEPYQTMSIPYARNLDGYHPKNNKLFTYPFVSLRVSNNEGDVKIYKYENFTKNLTSKVKFNCYAFFLNIPTMSVVPIDYLGRHEDFDEGINKTKFPSVAFNTQQFQVFMQNHLNSETLKNSASVAIPMLNGNVSGTIGRIANTIGRYQAMNEMPTQINNLSKVSNLQHAVGNEDIHFMESSIKKEYAKMADDFLTKYGYAIREIQKPNLRARSEWTYIQAIDMVINGDIPQKVEEEIKKIFENGITFWVEANHVGKYSELENVPLENEDGYIIRFSANGGSFTGGRLIVSLSTDRDGYINPPQNPTKDGYQFNWWYDSRTGGNPIQFDTPFDDNKTVYAQWTEVQPVTEFVPRLSLSESEARQITFYSESGANPYINSGIRLPACTCYAYGRCMEIANNVGKLDLVKQGGIYDWQAGTGAYASPYGDRPHYAYPSGENCVDSCSLGNWSVTQVPRLGDVISWWYEDGIYSDGHVAIVEEILERGGNNEPITLRVSDSNSGGAFFTTFIIKRDYYSFNQQDWYPTPSDKGKWYNCDGVSPKIWCGGFAHNPALDND